MAAPIGHHFVWIHLLVRLGVEEVLGPPAGSAASGSGPRPAALRRCSPLLESSRPASAFSAGTRGSAGSGVRPALPAPRRVKVTLRCLGPVASAMMNGRLMSVSVDWTTARVWLSPPPPSAAEGPSCPCRISDAVVLVGESLGQEVDDLQVEIVSTQVGVAVGRLRTSKTLPSPQISRIEISNVPPPRSYTATLTSVASSPDRRRGPPRWAR